MSGVNALHEGGVVLDPFLGSGTTALACITTGRQYIGIEKDPQYHEIATGRVKKARQQVWLF